MFLKFEKKHIWFYILGAFILVFAGAEIFLRIGEKDYQTGEYADINTTYPYPYREYGAEPLYRSEKINTNSIGLRGTRECQPKTDKCRVIILGGSAVFGMGVSSDDKTISVNLEKLLNKKFGENKFEVINAGQGFYESSSELMLYLTELLPLKPDLVILLDGFNDVSHSLILPDLVGYPVIYPQWKDKLLAITSNDLTIADIGRPIYKLMKKSELLKRLMLKSFIVGYNRGLYGKNLEQDASRKYPPNFKAIDKYIDNVIILSELNKIRGIKTLAALQPAIFYKEDLSLKERKYLENELDNSAYTQKDTILLMYEEMNKKLEGLAEDKKLLYFDNINRLLKDFPDEMFLDYSHLTDRGAEITAEKLLEILIKQNLI